MIIQRLLLLFILFLNFSLHAETKPSAPQVSTAAAANPAAVPPESTAAAATSATPSKPVAPVTRATNAKSEEPKTDAGLFKRDPFRLPKYLIEKITYKAPPAVDPAAPDIIDDRVDPIRRWGTKEYVLVGIIWEVKSPKALLKDFQNRVHVVKLRDKLGNKDGVITSITEGTVVVTEKKVPVVLRLKK